MTSSLHPKPLMALGLFAISKKLQENIKQTGSPGRRQPDIAFGGCRQGFLCQLRPLGKVGACTEKIAPKDQRITMTKNDRVEVTGDAVE
jgi:hypothetical protein